MYPSRKSKLIFQFFSWYSAYIIKKDFSSYTYDRLEVKEDEAILLLANHFSWWDGFLMFQLNKVVFKKEFHVLVSEEDYQRRWYLKYLGAFASKVKGKDVVKTLAYAGQLLDDPQNLVLLFPQGKLYTSYVSNISFEKGVMQLINASKKKFQVVFSATFTDYFDKRKPMAKSYLCTWVAEEYISLQLLKREYNKHYNGAIHRQSKKSA
ncbi:1-acyl-sn-glycerol-3-phosphate acyltransferase [Pedobacter gandavensis]|uniref:1-acyl-sn-glycerol-3-phosphate acyltransferase n=1 Tax=Pedobacter TaxID=84567 RepID=UPI001C9902CF|nr:MULTISPECIES: 1-acyl-sn-glycerol-3-phosphate acyltransferase [Pedobacter]WGQ12307.1 1-acyl-sn-glycerol-3-phosphate acyltransferase [Pedobacter gandavensis]